MNDTLVLELKKAIKEIKLEILEKENQLDILIEKYRELINNEIIDD